MNKGKNKILALIITVVSITLVAVSTVILCSGLINNEKKYVTAENTESSAEYKKEEFSVNGQSSTVQNTTIQSTEIVTEPDKITEVACVGDSITYGTGVKKNRNTQSYEAYLQGLLGDKYKVTGYGHPGATLQNSGDLPYRQQQEYFDSVKAEADIYILMLGTNDAKPENINLKGYEKELEDFINIYIDIAGKDNVFFMLPPKIFEIEKYTKYDRNELNYNLSAELDIIKKITEKLNIRTLNLYELTDNHPEWFADGIHPNAEGNLVIANEIYNTVFNNE